MPKRLTKKFLREVCLLNPSPWDDERLRFMLRNPTYGELLSYPENFEGTIDYVDMGEGWPDQGNRGTCVGWGVHEAVEISDVLRDQTPEDLSPEDMYNKARKYDGLPDWLEGSNNLGAMKALHKLGICLESCWPTSIDKNVPSVGQQCSDEDYEGQSKAHGIDAYYTVPLSVGGFKAALWGTTSDPQWGEGIGVPLVIGFKVPESITAEVDGICPIPEPGEASLGGHSTIITSWEMIDGHLYWWNPETWGKDVGLDGVLKLPVEYLTGGWVMDAWVFHYGNAIGPTPSDCTFANTYVDFGNLVAKVVNSRTRIPSPVRP